MISLRSPLMANALHPSNGKQILILPGQENAHYLIVPQSDAYDAIFRSRPKMGVPEIQEIAKKREEGDISSALKFQVIDDTAVILPSLNGNGKLNKNRQESRKEKKPKRKGGKAVNKGTLEEGTQARASDRKKGKEIRLWYSRKELETLRFENLEDQRRKWAEVYCGLDALVKQEYEGLVISANIHQKHSVPNSNIDPRPRFQRSANLIADAVAASVKENDPKIIVN